MDWLLEHMNNSKEGIKLTVEPIKENATYVTLSVDDKQVSHIKCKDFRFVHDEYEGYLRFTTESVPKSLFDYCRKYGYEILFDVVAYGVQYDSQIRIDAKECKLVSGINIDSEKPIELYFQVPDDYILDIT